MEVAKNPFTPDAGRQPPELTGREAVLENAEIALKRMLNGNPTNSMVLRGLRGVGKTVLLTRIGDMAYEKGFKVARIEAPEAGGLAQKFIPELWEILLRIDPERRRMESFKQALSAIRNFASMVKIRLGGMDIEVKPSPGIADTGDLEHDLPKVITLIGQEAKECNAFIALVIDEMQLLSSEELSALCAALHQVSQRDFPIHLVGAGLPHITALLGNAKSYSERMFNFAEVGPLDAEAVRNAIVKPIKCKGEDIEDEAVQEIFNQTEGYPYFVQEWGSHVWDRAPQSPIRREDVCAAQERILGKLDQGFFRVRYDRMTPLQKKYLRAMAEPGAESRQTGRIAQLLGVKPEQISPTRNQLLKMGMIWSPSHGEAAFTVPHFDKFMLREMKVLEPHVPRIRRNR